RNQGTTRQKPAGIPGRKKLAPSRPLRLGLEGDRSIASDAAVMDMALASPSLGQSIDIYGRVANAATPCGPLSLRFHGGLGSTRSWRQNFAYGQCRLGVAAR